MEDWENLSDDEKWAVKHILEYNARHWEGYYDDSISPLAGEFVITNPSVYLSDGKTTVIEGTFTIRKLN